MLISLFKIAPQDQSVYYLGQIFGFVGSVLPVTNPPLLMGMLFKILNTMALTIGAFLVVYVTVVGLLKTAQEGEFLGRNWNSLWIPVRTVLGIVALFPTSTGYSAIQVVIMWIILQGVGAADVMWNKALDYTSLMGSPYAGVSSGPSSLNLLTAEGTMKSLFQGLVCQASAKASYPDLETTSTPGSTIKYYCSQPSYASSPFCQMGDSAMLNIIQDNNPNTYKMGPSGTCGSLNYCSLDVCKPPQKQVIGADGKPVMDKNGKPEMEPEDDPALITAALKSAPCLSCKAQRSALQSIVPALGAIAGQLVTVDYQYSLFYETILSKAGSPPDWIRNYCAAKGIAPAQCCRISSIPGLTCSYKFFPADYDFSTKTADYNNTSSSTSQPSDPPDSATNFFLQYPLAIYLNGSDFINAATGEYAAALVGAVSASIENKMDGRVITSGWINDAKKFGWILAGAYYYKMAGENQVNQAALYPRFEVAAPDPNSEIKNNYRNNYTATGNLLAAMVQSNASSSGGSPGFAGNVPGISGDISGAMDSAGAGLLHSWMSSMTSNSCAGTDCTRQSTNPLISVATFGYQMMIIAQLLFVVIVIAVGAYTLLAGINPIILGSGLTLNPVGESIKAVVSIVGPFFVVLISALFSIGALLGIYVPLIPYMIFTVGAIGWLIATIEAMVAGPIMALGILSPGGQHDFLGRAEQSMFHLLNLFLRPSLMVLGMIASMFLCIAAINLVNTGFLAAVASIMKNPGLFEQIMFIAAYTSFIVTIVNKAFSLIYVIPERVTTWIGGHAIQYGEEQAMGATRQSVEGGASTTTGSARESGGAVHGGVMAARSSDETKKKQAESGSGAPQVGAGSGASGTGTGSTGSGTGSGGSTPPPSGP